MNSAGTRKHKARLFTQRYQEYLCRYVRRLHKANLRQAEVLGRKAVAIRLETLDLALIHEQALISAMETNSSVPSDQVIKRARDFFAEAILPLEETHRSALEANAHLIRLNAALSRRTTNLETSSRMLKQQIARRRVVEKTLLQSEMRSTELLAHSQRMQEQLRILSRGILSDQEKERKRISRELHDVIGQVLTGINMRLAVLKTEATVNAKGLTKSIAHTQRLVEKSVTIVRRFAYNLRPSALDDLGLLPCLESFMTNFIQDTGIKVSLTAFAGVERLNNDRRTALYRVVQESLTNISRHAQATRCEVVIERLGNSVGMRIKDNGRSFDVEHVLRSKKIRRLGLLGMRERIEMVGGSFRIESEPGKGTTINAKVPFKNGARKHIRP